MKDGLAKPILLCLAGFWLSGPPCTQALVSVTHWPFFNSSLSCSHLVLILGIHVFLFSAVWLPPITLPWTGLLSAQTLFPGNLMKTQGLWSLPLHYVLFFILLSLRNLCFPIKIPNRKCHLLNAFLLQIYLKFKKKKKSKGWENCCSRTISLSEGSHCFSHTLCIQKGPWHQSLSTSFSD